MKTLKNRTLNKINRSNRQVFKRSDFKNLGNYDQVGRALLELTREKQLIKIAYGLYAKARPNRITGKPMLASPGGFNDVCREGLNRLNINWEYDEAIVSYLEGNTPQVPIEFQPIIRGRFNRKFYYDTWILSTK